MQGSPIDQLRLARRKVHSDSTKVPGVASRTLPNREKAMKRPTDGWRFRAAQILFLSALSGCGTTGVNALSQSTYSVSAQYGSLNGSWSRAQREAVAKAQQYCDAKKETYAFISEQRSGVVGFSPQSSTIIFSCGPNTSAAIQAAVPNARMNYGLQEAPIQFVRRSSFPETPGKAPSPSPLLLTMPSLPKWSVLQLQSGRP